MADKATSQSYVVADKRATAIAGANKLDWQQMPRGGVIDMPGSAEEYETGDWRSQRPVFHEDRCIQCLFCWIVCPDASVTVEDKKMVGFDYYHCKGCGVCATECPTKGEKAITMEDESKFEMEKS
jgi:2-oxoacid:acceptor oxidoreductase delta subunit (pyruvate/2-ketoisovalerate family)